MELWTRGREELGWTPWPDTARGLASLLDHANGEVLLLTRAPDRELEELSATLLLIQTLTRRAARVIIASPHPAPDWADPLLALGADQLWLVDGSSTGLGPALTKTAELPAAACPHLHAKTTAQATLSVCGCHHDLMVLARHHLERWCLTGDRACPHRNDSAAPFPSAHHP